MNNSFLSLRFAEEAQEHFSLEVEKIRFGDAVLVIDVATAQRVRKLRSDLGIVVADESSRTILMEKDLELGDARFCRFGN